MRNSPHTKTRLLSTVAALVVVATLALAAPRTQDAAGSGKLPGTVLDGLSVQRICGGGETAEIGDTPCSFDKGEGGCSGVTGAYYGTRCSDEGGACGAGSCTGANNYVCKGSGEECPLKSGYCCTVSVTSCVTLGDGTEANPFYCDCAGPYVDLSADSRTVPE